MNDQACAYPGCPNAPDDTVLDGPTREKIREGVIYMNREGVFDFPDPPTYRRGMKHSVLPGKPRIPRLSVFGRGISVNLRCSRTRAQRDQPRWMGTGASS